MASRAVDAALAGGGFGHGARSDTARRSVSGGPRRGRGRALALSGRLSLRAESIGAPPALVRHLAARYGVRAEGVVAILEADPSSSKPLVEGLPDCEAEVLFAARHEDARRASDVLIRRTHLFWQAHGQGASAVSRVHAILDRELGWTPAGRRSPPPSSPRSRPFARGGLRGRRIAWRMALAFGEVRERRGEERAALGVEPFEERLEDADDAVLFLR